jgi:hypothetical protein
VEAPLQPGFRLDLIFSGFNAEYRLQLHETIFDVVWFGEGRWSWKDVYDMPVFLRRFWIKKITRMIKDRADSIKKQQQQHKSNKPKLPTKPRR